MIVCCTGLMALQAQYLNYDDVVKLSFQSFGDSKIEGNNWNLVQNQFHVEGGWSFELNEKKDKLTFGARYDFLNLQLDSARLNQTKQGHSIFAGGEFLKYWKSPYWATTISAYVGVASDMDSVFNKSYQTAISGMMHYGESDDVIFTFGLYYSDQPFGPWVFPLVGVDWRISDRTYFSVMLLYRLYFEYALVKKKVYVGLENQAQGTSYTLTNFNNQGLSYITSFSEQFPYYPFNNSVFVDCYFKENYVLFAKGGYAIGRSFKNYNTKDKAISTSPLNGNVSDNWVLEIGLAYRIRKF